MCGLLGGLPLRRRRRDRPRLGAVQQLGRAAVRDEPAAARGRPARAHVLPPRPPAALRQGAGGAARARRCAASSPRCSRPRSRPARPTSPRRSPTRFRRARSASGSGCPTTSGPYLKGVSEQLFDAEEGRGDDPASRAALQRGALRLLAAARARAGRAARATRGDRPHHGHPRRDATAFTPSTEESCVELVRLLLTAGHNSTTGGHRQLDPADRAGARDPAPAARRAGADPGRDRGVPPPRDAGSGDAALAERGRRAARADAGARARW